MLIRNMTINDYEQVYELWASTDGVQPHPVDNSREAMARYIVRNPTSTFVAVDDNDCVVGVILCGHDGRRGYIYQVAVAEELRGQGVGTKLVNAGLAALQAEGIGRCGLFVLVKQRQAIDYWEKLGFESKEFMTFRLKDL